MRGYKGKNGEHGRHGGLLKRQGGSQHRGRHGGICLAARRSAAGQGFAAATLVGTGVHARRCWFRWAAWLGEQSVAPVAADGRHTNHCFESAAHRPTAAVQCAPIPSPRPVRHSHTRPSAAGALGPESAARASPPLSARLASLRQVAQTQSERRNAAALLLLALQLRV